MLLRDNFPTGCASTYFDQAGRAESLEIISREKVNSVIRKLDELILRSGMYSLNRDPCVVSRVVEMMRDAIVMHQSFEKSAHVHRALLRRAVDVALAVEQTKIACDCH